MSDGSAAPGRPTGVGTVMTFNIGRGATGPAGTGPDDLGRVGSVIAADGGVDVACLQEVHAADVPVLLALLDRDHGLGHHAHFTATVPEAGMRARLARAVDRGDADRVAHLEGRQSDYGLAILARAPLTAVADHPLPDDRRERRMAQQVATRIGGASVTILNTHIGLVTERRLVEVLSLRPARQRAQTAAFLALAARVDGPVIATGDLNQVPEVLARARRRSRLRLVSDCPRPTCGHHVIDHILAGTGVTALATEVREVPVSDHDPVVVRVAIST